MCRRLSACDLCVLTCHINGSFNSWDPQRLVSHGYLVWWEICDSTYDETQAWLNTTYMMFLTQSYTYITYARRFEFELTAFCWYFGSPEVLSSCSSLLCCIFRGIISAVLRHKHLRQCFSISMIQHNVVSGYRKTTVKQYLKKPINTESIETKSQPMSLLFMDKENRGHSRSDTGCNSLLAPLRSEPY